MTDARSRARFASAPVVLVLGAAGAAAHLVNAPQDELRVVTQPVAGTIRMLEGAGGFVGGNLAVSVGDEGVFVIDSYLAEHRGLLAEAVEALGGGEVRLAVNTHWHGDHAGNNAWLREQGGEVVAHENVRRRLAGDADVEGRKVEDPDPAAVPSVTYESSLRLHLNGEAIVLEHVVAAHTDGDSLVWFPDSKVVHMGDCFFKDRFPFIDLSSGGSPSGALAVAEHVLDGTDDSWKIVPGHGSLATRADLERYAEMLDIVIGRVQEGLDDGQTFEEMRGAGILDDLAEEWGGGFIDKDRMLSSVAIGLQRGL